MLEKDIVVLTNKISVKAHNITIRHTSISAVTTVLTMLPKQCMQVVFLKTLPGNQARALAPGLTA